MIFASSLWGVGGGVGMAGSAADMGVSALRQWVRAWHTDRAAGSRFRVAASTWRFHCGTDLQWWIPLSPVFTYGVTGSAGWQLGMAAGWACSSGGGSLVGDLVTRNVLLQSVVVSSWAGGVPTGCEPRGACPGPDVSPAARAGRAGPIQGEMLHGEKVLRTRICTSGFRAGGPTRRATPRGPSVPHLAGLGRSLAAVGEE